VGSKGFPRLTLTLSSGVLGYRNEHGEAVDEVCFERQKHTRSLLFLIVEPLTKHVLVSRAQNSTAKHILLDLTKQSTLIVANIERVENIDKKCFFFPMSFLYSAVTLT
jgi:hypothetical protein